MDCSICYAAIDASTGKVELSCSHVFHLNCLSIWFKTQSERYTDQNCPCCRHVANETEIIPDLHMSQIDRFKEYEEEVKRWHIAVKDQMVYRHVQIQMLEDDVRKYKLLLESAEIRNKRLEADARKIAWAQWSSTARAVRV